MNSKLVLGLHVVKYLCACELTALAILLQGIPLSILAAVKLAVNAEIPLAVTLLVALEVALELTVDERGT